MRLFDLSFAENKRINQFLRWHAVYLFLIAGFFVLINETGVYKKYYLLRERTIFLFLAPLTTALFVLLSPWRARWLEALRGMYERLEGQEIFCFLAAWVFLFGFFIYSIFIWGLGALGPSLFYM
ncbi:MAG: hypothetical protein LBV23_02765 [Deltaproteobacteria bacterium]|jgi:hypothetical protein|nr:hypothetical protein [Deltaproteobacteria bacterium]